MSKHTPGPWEVRPDRHNASRGWREIYAGRTPIVDSMSFERRSMGETEFHCGVRISEDNARLIAAAPTMLSALKEVAHHADDEFGFMVDVRKAIAKAEGRSDD